MRKLLIIVLLVAPVTTSLCQEIEHVFVIGIDGMSPGGLMNASTPAMDKLMKNGAYTLHARNVLPSSSSQNWASMIMGAGPEQHGITSNKWQLDDHELPPVVKTEAGIFPTIFWLIKKNDPGAKTGAIYHWEDFGRLFEKTAVDKDLTFKNENMVAEEAAKYILEDRPKFLFVHLDHVDGAGHKFGHGTTQYYGGVSKADELIGKIVASVVEAGLIDQSLIIISSDHGGKDTGHGGESLAEVEIPIILSGPLVKPGFEITDPTNIYDIASTVAYVFGYDQPKAWIGRPITSAFK
jgi:predicted AlkP superfamily pyrophosphatase or phosphodiesterase